VVEQAIVEAARLNDAERLRELSTEGRLRDAVGGLGHT
jgi:hypothetical protein